MDRENLIRKTLDNISKLPEQSLQEVSDFAEFLLSKVEEQTITEGIKKMSSESGAFDFLNEDEVSYTVKDLKEKFK
jgi:hypothetical protein